LTGSKSDFLFVADSGSGETDAKGLIVPRFGSKPENHVAVSMTFESTKGVAYTIIRFLGFRSYMYITDAA